MLKKAMFVGLTVGVLALGAPVALASHQPQAVGCRFSGVMFTPAADEDVRRDLVEGYVVGQPGEAVSIRCEVRVGTSVRGATSTAPGATVAAVGEPVTYLRALSETTTLCAVWSVGGHMGENCSATTTTQIPPQPILDLIEDTLGLLDEDLGPLPVECGDNIDNDGDGYTDFPSDSGCSDSIDTTEGDGPCRVVLGASACVSYTTTPEPSTYQVLGPSSTPHRVAGYLDLYRFRLPNDATVNLPCVVVDGGTDGNACATAGGEFVSRIAVLADETPSVPTTELTPIATLRVCPADLVVTVNNIGVSSFPGYAPC